MESRLLLASALALAAAWTAAEHCGGRGGGRIIVDVTTRRNATGHRHVKADLFAREEKLGNGAVDFRVEQGVDTLNGVRYFHLISYTIALEASGPPPGYELVRGLGWYRQNLKLLTWAEARLTCESEGAHLAVLNSRQEAAALTGIFARAPSKMPGATWSDYAFIGFSDVIEGSYTTIFGETLEEAGYAEWKPGYPQNRRYSAFDIDSDCGSIYKENGKLEDLPCKANLTSFCEYPL